MTCGAIEAVICSSANITDKDAFPHTVLRVEWRIYLSKSEPTEKIWSEEWVDYICIQVHLYMIFSWIRFRILSGATNIWKIIPIKISDYADKHV